VISRVELIRKDKENIRSARKIPPSGKPALSRFSTSEFFRAKRPFSFVGIHFAALENRLN
jgi:hypothetical protein